MAHAASQSLDAGLQLAFRRGAVMGLVVVGLALLDISVWFLVLMRFVDEADQTHQLPIITTTMLTFGMGASLQALLTRVGGGIFTKPAAPSAPTLSEKLKPALPPPGNPILNRPTIR